MPRVDIQHLYKVYGEYPEKAFPLMEEGKTREEIREVTGQVVGVKDADFTVKDGELFVIMGLSGSGKSTLLRCVNRLVEPTKGDIVIGGTSIPGLNEDELREFRRHNISMAFQHFGLLPFRSTYDNVKLPLEIQGELGEDEIHERVMESLRMAKLEGWEDNYPSEMSGGMQQRIGMARALAPDPDVLLLDECFSELDPLIKRRSQDELLEIQERAQKTILFVTHDLAEALKVGDRMAILNKEGEVVQIAEPQKVMDSPSTEYVERFTEDIRKFMGEA